MFKKLLTRVSILGLGVTLLLSSNLTSPVKAATSETTDVEVNIVSGPFTIIDKPTLVDFTRQLRDVDYIVTQKLPNRVQVTDMRGSQVGWRVDVSGTQLQDSGGHKLPKGSLYINDTLTVERAVLGIDIGDLKGDTTPVMDRIDAMFADTSYDATATTITNALPLDDGSSINVAKATSGKGMGTFNLIDNTSKALALKVNYRTLIPDGVSNSYTSVLTWNLISAP